MVEKKKASIICSCFGTMCTGKHCRDDKEACCDECMNYQPIDSCTGYCTYGPPREIWERGKGFKFFKKRLTMRYTMIPWCMQPCKCFRRKRRNYEN